MKKLYSLFAAVVIAVVVNAQTKTITLTSSDFAGLNINNYNAGIEKTLM